MLKRKKLLATMLMTLLMTSCGEITNISFSSSQGTSLSESTTQDDSSSSNLSTSSSSKTSSSKTSSSSSGKSSSSSSKTSSSSSKTSSSSKPSSSSSSSKPSSSSSSSKPSTSSSSKPSSTTSSSKPSSSSSSISSSATDELPYETLPDKGVEVVFDNNTITLTDIKIIDKEYPGKKVYMSKDEGVRKYVGKLDNSGTLSLSWSVASLDKNKLSFLIEGSDHCKTLDKLTTTEMNALQRSYGFQNAYCSTYNEIYLQAVYVAENGISYRTGKSTVLGDNGTNLYSIFSNKDNYSYLVYPSSMIDVDAINTIVNESQTIPNKFAISLMKDLNYGIGYSTISEDNKNYFNNTNVLAISSGLKNKKDNITPSTVTDNLPSFAGYKPYYGKGTNSLPVESFPTVNHVSTGFSVYAYITHGYRPICESGSSAEKVYNNAKSVLKAILDDTMSEAQKALAIYDWITFRGTYNSTDINNDYNQLIDGLLKDSNYNLTVCNGYALAFATLATMAGLDAKYVMGYAGENHAWNEVKIDNKWYCVDTTWGKTSVGEYQLENHMFFLISWDELSALTTGGRSKTPSYTYYVDSLATNGNYPYYKDVAEGFTYNGSVYSRYIDSDAKLNIVVEYLKEKHYLWNNNQLVNDMYIATFNGYTKSTSDRMMEEFGFSSSELLEKFKTKTAALVMQTNSNNYNSYFGLLYDTN